MGLQVDPGVVWNSNVFIYITHPQQCVQTDRQPHVLVFAPAAAIDTTPTDWFPHQQLLFESVSWNLGARNWLAILIFLVEIDHILVLFMRVITHVLKMLQVEGAAIDMHFRVFIHPNHRIPCYLQARTSPHRRSSCGASS